MKRVLKLLCIECLRTAEVDPESLTGNVPTTCAFCGGAVEPQEPDSPAEYQTPLSLELTPEETDEWTRREERSERNPRQVGRFQLREILGGGGYGQVYRAYDPRLDRDVALKVLRDERPTARVLERFFREARAAAQLDHPCIVTLHDAGRDDGYCWIAYQFVRGRTLWDYLVDRAGAVDFEQVARMTCDLAEGLAHAHQRGVFHRDIKPTNVILDDTGRPRLTDFGLARRMDYEPTLTIEGAILGTPAYMSPEQASGRGHVADARSDIYSLGVVFYELLCGQRPPALPSNMPAWRAESPAPLPPPRTVDPRVPRVLDRICRKALAPDPAGRFADARAFAAQLREWLARRSRRSLIWRWTAVGVTLGAIGASLVWAGRGGEASVRGAVSDGADPAKQAPSPKGQAPRIKAQIRIPVQPAPGAPEARVIPFEFLYHQPGCLTKGLEGSPSISLEEALSRKLRPCVLCRPPRSSVGARPGEAGAARSGSLEGVSP